MKQAKSYLLCAIFMLFTKIGFNQQSSTTNFNSDQTNCFYENKGQISKQNPSVPDVQFYSRQKNMSVFLHNNGISYQFQKRSKWVPTEEEHMSKVSLEEKFILETARMEIQFVGSNTNPEITTCDQTTYYENYYPKGIDSVYGYETITFHNIYPKIDWVIYWNNGKLKYDFVVKPGGNPDDIHIELNHAEDLQMDEKGNIKLKNKLGEVTDSAPISFQSAKKVHSEFILLDKNQYGISVQEYNKSQELVIDPTLTWISYLGGNDWDHCFSVSTDSQENLIAVGETSSTNFIASGGYQTTFSGASDAFISKYDNSGNLLWSTYYGGTNGDGFYNVAIDSYNNIITSGKTWSSGLGINGWQNSYSGFQSLGLMLKLNPAGTPIWCTYFGTGGIFRFEGCAIDQNDNIYASGSAQANPTFVMNGHQTNYGGGNADAFIVKFDSTGMYKWGSYYGDSGEDEGWDVAVDKSGNPYLCGETTSNSTIAYNGFQMTYAGSTDAFLVKFDSLGTRIWSTYYGNSFYNGEGATCITDNLNNVYLASHSAFGDDLAYNGHQMTNGGGSLTDGLLAKFDSTGQRIWATLYGGESVEYGFDCKTDANDNVYLYGLTMSNIAINYNGFQTTLADAFVDQGDAYIVKFDSAGTRLWGTYMGGPNEELASEIHISASGIIYACGRTNSITGLTTGGFQNTFGGGSHDGYIARIFECQTSNSSINQTSCDSFFWNETGQTYTVSDTYNETLTNIQGCDSVITLNLTINTTPNNNVNSGSGTLTAQAPGVNYQWLDCNNAYAQISGEVNQTFVPQNNGIYAVEVSNNGCADTSICITIQDLGFIESEHQKSKLMKVTDLLGKETVPKPNMVLLFWYEDGMVEKIYRIKN